MKLSIVVPVYNSRAILPHLLEAIEKERLQNNWDLELLLVDDGSHDQSFEQIAQLAKQYPYIRGFQHSRNFGQQAALRTALKRVQGDVIAIIDDDLQDPPELIPAFIQKLDEGYDVVYGVRRNRKESLWKRLAYKLFYKFLRAISEIQIPLDSGDFCVMRRTVVNQILRLEEQNPFIRGIRYWVGYRQIGHEYERPGRHSGESGMSLRRLLRFAFDGLYSFSDLPLKLTLVLGCLGFGFALIYGIVILSKYFIFGVNVEGFTTLILTILFFGSINLICMGILGEYIARIYAEGKRRPHAIVSNALPETELNQLELEQYQSTVSLRPSSKAHSGAQANSDCALE